MVGQKRSRTHGDENPSPGKKNCQNPEAADPLPQVSNPLHERNLRKVRNLRYLNFAQDLKGAKPVADQPVETADSSHQDLTESLFLDAYCNF